MNGPSTVGSVFQSAAATISRASAAAEQDAAVVANATMAGSGTGGGLSVGSGDFVNALIDARQQTLYTAAAARMISTSNQMLGSLLDITA
jgi:hypothetical protein